jgi:hypothetical protein
MNMDRRYMVKQWVAEIDGPYCRFRVFKTGDEKWYLFCVLDTYGCQTDIQFPVLRADLARDVRSALAHGIDLLNSTREERWRRDGRL